MRFLSIMAVATVALSTVAVSFARQQQQSVEYDYNPRTGEYHRSGGYTQHALQHRRAAVYQALPGVVATGSGIVRSRKTGATANVSPRWAPKFQAYIDDLEARGAEVKFMGGYRKGVCGLASQHVCGSALDVCQLAWGVVDKRCNLPEPATVYAIARSHDLYEGGCWGRSDYGHVQGVFSAECRRNIYGDVTAMHKQRLAEAGRDDEAKAFKIASLSKTRHRRVSWARYSRHS